jgi:hypothetical protein
MGDIATFAGTPPVTITFNGGCACPIEWGLFPKPLPTRAVFPDPWRDLDAGIRALDNLLGGAS